MEYIKFEIDELTNNSVFCEYREVNENGKGELKTRSFPLEKISEEVPQVPEMVAGIITNIYYEQRGAQVITEKKDINGLVIPLTDEEQEFCVSMAKEACINEKWDELLKPPSVDEQVEDFIKQFFEEDDEPLEQKDFLAEFFEELEQTPEQKE
jgi:hypothetical protein